MSMNEAEEDGVTEVEAREWAKRIIGVLMEGNSKPQSHWAISRCIFGWRLLLASGEWRPGMLLNTLQYMEQPHHQP